MIDKSIVVRVGTDRAFTSWHENVHLWWPRGHHISGDASGVMVFEAHAGGRFYERTEDGREFDYGEIVDFEPHALLRYTFFLGTGAAHPTLVEVRFTAIEQGTRVDVRHHAHAAGERFAQTAKIFHASWERTLASFGEFHA